MTELLFREDAYLRDARARVIAVEDRGIVLDRTVFYPRGGGQPGDTGLLATAWGEIAVCDTIHAADRQSVVHVAAEGAALPEVGESVEARIDWPKRLARMKIHTALHLLTAVLPYPVTGGGIGDGEGRLDFDIAEAGLERDAIQAKLQALIDRDAAVGTRWISDDALLANPTLVKTMSVKPPMGSGRVRLVEVEGIDLQPCGGTHVARTGEIGRVAVTGIEKKGRQNRRVRIALVA